MDNIFDFSHTFSLLAQKAENMTVTAGNYLSGLSGIKAAAVVLFLTTLVLILCLVLVWYVKSIIASVQREKLLEREYRAKIDNRLDKKLAADDEDIEIGHNEENGKVPADKKENRKTTANRKYLRPTPFNINLSRKS